jgi:hypothetical protein
LFVWAVELSSPEHPETARNRASEAETYRERMKVFSLDAASEQAAFHESGI